MSGQNILDDIHSPDDVKKLSLDELPILCNCIRYELIKTVSVTGGHLASNLGVVELTVALHYIFDSPNDQIVWDVGHQCYTHKLLTGRKDRFQTLRQEGGLSGFPRQNESIHDAFIAGHSSTSISAACGLAKANTLHHNDHSVIAVLGDGSFTGGMIYEGMNNAGKSSDRLIIILNDNDMSISKSTGALANYLSNIRLKSSYQKFKNTLDNALKHLPLVGNKLRETLLTSKSVVKQILYHSTFFEELGFVYLGPIDGHDLKSLLKALTLAQRLACPVFVHIKTIKGKGYSFAENNPGAYHGVSKFNPLTGDFSNLTDENYSNRFGMCLVSLANEDSRICATTAAMKYGTGLQFFAKKYRERFFDVGIAEQHAVTFSAGLARNGMLPVFAVYSTFLQRAYDQVIHDAAIENAHIVLAVDRAGLVGEDGETHQGIFDASYLSAIPNMKLYSPSNYREVELCLKKCLYEETGICALRYPRGKEPVIEKDLQSVTDSYHLLTQEHFSGGIALSKNGPAAPADKQRILLVSYGREIAPVCGAAKKLCALGYHVFVLKLCQISPIPPACIELALPYERVFFVEEGIRKGGIGEHFGSLLQEADYAGHYHIRAIEDRYVDHAPVERLLNRLGLDAGGIESFVRQNIEKQEKNT